MWRVVLLVTFLPLAIPWGVLAFIQMLIAGAAWLVAGPSEERTDHILLAPPSAWFADVLDWLVSRGKARS